MILLLFYAGDEIIRTLPLLVPICLFRNCFQDLFIIVDCPTSDLNCPVYRFMTSLFDALRGSLMLHLIVECQEQVCRF